MVSVISYLPITGKPPPFSLSCIKHKNSWKSYSEVETHVKISEFSPLLNAIFDPAISCANIVALLDPPM
jgi:hypothetical protein